MLRAVLISLLAAIAILLVFVFSARPKSTPALPLPPVAGQIAPEIHAKAWLNADGPQSLEKYRDKFVVVEFWATWCPPCVKSVPHLNELQAKHEKDVVILALSDEPLAKVEAFAAQYGMKYRTGTESKSFTTYAIDAIPHAVLIAPGGKIVWQGSPDSSLEDAIARQLENRKTQPDERSN